NPIGDFGAEREVLKPTGAAFFAAPADRDAEIWDQAEKAKVVLFRAAKLDEASLEKLKNCRAVIRYGIGLDKVDIPAATKRGIAVCTVPDFCTHEMADHAITLAMALIRKLSTYQRLAREESWLLTREHPLAGCRGLLFATFGFGRIAREVLARAEAFGF